MGVFRTLGWSFQDCSGIRNLGLEGATVGILVLSSFFKLAMADFCLQVYFSFSTLQGFGNSTELTSCGALSEKEKGANMELLFQVFITFCLLIFGIFY